MIVRGPITNRLHAVNDVQVISREENQFTDVHRSILPYIFKERIWPTLFPLVKFVRAFSKQTFDRFSRKAFIFDIFFFFRFLFFSLSKSTLNWGFCRWKKFNFKVKILLLIRIWSYGKWECTERISNVTRLNLAY